MGPTTLRPIRRTNQWLSFLLKDTSILAGDSIAWLLCSNCTVFCVQVNIERGVGGENVFLGGSEQGMVIVTLGMGGPSILDGILATG